MRRSLLALALLSAIAAPALSADYFVVVPVKGRTTGSIPPAPEAPSISVTLSSYNLPSGQLGLPYSGFDFKSVLQVTGDPSFQPGGVAFTSADLNNGLSLSSDGLLSGTPAVLGASNFTVSAAYKGVSAQNTFSLDIQQPIYGVVAQPGGYRTWGDGTFPSTCSGYLNPGEGYAYSGSVGDGVYRINFQGTPVNVYCNMTWAGGGWMLAIRETAAPTVTRSIGSMTVQGYAMSTQGDAERPALPNGTVNQFTEGLVAGGTSAWQNLYGQWVKFQMRPYTTSPVSLTLPNVSSQTGKSVLAMDRIAWGSTTMPPSYTFGAFWDANGASPICGGNSNPLPKNCPSFSAYTQRSDGSLVATATFSYHFNTSGIREFYVR